MEYETNVLTYSATINAVENNQQVDRGGRLASGDAAGPLLSLTSSSSLFYVLVFLIVIFVYVSLDVYAF